MVGGATDQWLGRTLEDWFRRFRQTLRSGCVIRASCVVLVHQLDEITCRSIAKSVESQGMRFALLEGGRLPSGGIAMAQRLQFEFPEDTSDLIEKLSHKLKLSRAEVIAKGLGLLNLLVQAHDDRRIFVERPKSGERGEEFEIDIRA